MGRNTFAAYLIRNIPATSVKIRTAAQPKELYIVPNASHVDLYGRMDLIPFDKLTTFFTQYLKEVAPKEKSRVVVGANQ